MLATSALSRRFERTNHWLDAPLVVSLTSYPPRFPTLLRTLRSLLNQTVRPDRTILWIADEDLPALPEEVRSLETNGLEIRSCSNLGPFKKLVPALQAFPDAYIVTADDDLYYSPGWLRTLVEEASAWPGSIVAHRAHLAKRGEDGRFQPYSEWQQETRIPADLCSRNMIFPTGGAGTIYPPNSLDPRVTDSSLFMQFCPRADDVWFFWMAEFAGTPQRLTARGHPLVTWRGSQDVALYHSNMHDHQNDVQIANLQDYFGTLPMPEQEERTPARVAS